MKKISSLSLLLTSLIVLPASGAIWIDGSSNWNINGNWNTGIFPNAVDAVAEFVNLGPTITTRQINLPTAITVGTLTVNTITTNNDYVFLGTGGSLAFSTSSGNAQLNGIGSNPNPTRFISLPIILNSTLDITHSNGGNLLFQGNGNFSGTGGINYTGSSGRALDLQDNIPSTYSGPTNINQGTVNYLFNGVLPAGNNVTIGGPGTALLNMSSGMSAANAFNATVNSNGTLFQVSTGSRIELTGLSGSGAVTLQNTATAPLVVQGGAGNTTFSGTLSGGLANVSTDPTVGSSLTKNGNSRLTLTGTNSGFNARTFIGSTAPASSIINVQNTSALGTSTSANSGVYVLSGGALELQLANQTFAKRISINGSGVSNTGALRNISGNNTISTQLNVGWTGGAVTASDATIGIDAGSLTFTADIVGAGRQLTKVGAGSLILNANSNLSALNLNAGETQINGTSTGNVNVAAGASLIGSGSIVGNLDNFGSVSPGNGIGTFNVVGNATFEGGSTYNVDILPSSSADLLNVTGPVSINSSSSVVLNSLGSSTATQFVIINSSTSRTGMFSGVNQISPFFVTSLSYNATQVLLNIDFLPLSAFVSTGNPGIVAAYLDAQDPADGSDFAFVINSLDLLASPAALFAALDQLHPAPFNGFALTEEEVATTVRSAISSRGYNLYRNYCCGCTPCGRTIWFDGVGDFIDQDAQNGNIGFHAKSYGFIVGYENSFESGVRLGKCFSYMKSDVDWDHHQVRGDIHSYNFALYASAPIRCFWIDAALLGGFNRLDGRRHIAFPGIDRIARHKSDDWLLDGHLGAAYPIGCFSRFYLTPYGELDYIRLFQGGFTESGADSINLDVHHKEADLLRGEAGVELTGAWAIGCCPFYPTLSLGCVREWRFNGKGTTAEMEGGVGSFTVFGLNPNRTLFAPEVDFRLIAGRGWEFDILYASEIGHDVLNQRVVLEIDKSF